MPEATPPTLDALRVEIDKIDGKLHALLRARAEVVSHVAAAKAAASGGAPSPAFRPGREASMMRRLIGNHKGPVPGTIPGADLARDHFRHDQNAGTNRRGRIPP